MYDNQEVLNSMMKIGSSAIQCGFKVGGEVAKAMLLIALDKVKENKENRVGLTSLKNLARSKDELNILSLKKENLEYFKKQCKKLGVSFGAVKNTGENMKILYKTKDVLLVKDILSELLDKQKANKLDEFQEKSVYDAIEDNMDFPAIGDGFHRQQLKGTTNEKSTAIGDILRANNIDNNIVVMGVNEDNTFNIDYRVDLKDKEKAIEIIDSNKDKSIEELCEALEELEKSRFRPKIINPEASGLEKYGVKVETEKYIDKWGKAKETYSMKIGDKKINHVLDEKYYSTIEATLKKLGFSKDQISELKKEDPFVQSRLKKEDYYSNILNKSNNNKESLDDQINKAKKQQNTKQKQSYKNKTKSKTKSHREDRD